MAPQSRAAAEAGTSPYAFTEQGVAMLSSVLHSSQAVRVNIEIMRAFVRLRQVLAGNVELAHRLTELERRVGDHDQQFASVIRAIRELMTPPLAPIKRRIGFHAVDDPPSETPPMAKRKAGLRVDRNRRPTTQ